MRVTSLATVALSLGLVVACSASSNNKKTADPPAGVAVTLFFTTELRGNIEPCGCTSNPMGDLARTAAVIAQARHAQPNVLYLDGGSSFHGVLDGKPAGRAQEDMKAQVLLEALSQTLRVDAIGLGPYDLARGPAAVRPARQAVNIPADAGIALDPSKIIEIGGTTIGIFGVVAAEAFAATAITPTDPVAAATAAAADLRGRGARLVIGIAHMPRKQAVALAKKSPGIDFLLVAQNAPEPNAVQPAAIKVGDTYLIRPANRGQVVSRLELNVGANGPFTDAIGKARAQREIAKLGERADKLRADLDKWSNDDTADPAFIATKKRELAEFEAERAALEKTPLRIPDHGNWFSLEQIEITKQLPCDETMQAAKIAFDKAAGAANLAAAASLEPIPPGTGEARYVGGKECEECHEEAAESWQKRGHGRAWATLDKIGKALDYDCIGCHVTGWDKPGGSTLAFSDGLRDVQCETCHGPGSLHIEVDDDDELFRATTRRVPPESVCLECHTSDHSDLFDYEAYLRNVTGPGHGEEFRKKLGDGPTATSLAESARKRVGKDIGPGCIK